MNWELVVHVIIGIAAIGSFMGRTKYALGVIESRLDKLEGLCYACDRRLAAIETHLRGVRAPNT